MPLPSITISGNLTRDPEVRFLQTGTAVTSLRVAASDRKKDENGVWKDGDPCYLDVTVWREAGENVAESLRKGDAVLISGRLRQRTYTNKEGAEVTVFDVEADDIAPSLKRATVSVSKRSGSHAAGTRTAPADNPWADEVPPF
jgi:single-strand DNA-binding protein